ncbi:uncharacterized protein LOC143020664 isoform X2 [Oratosquilla oratoria]|uniref:uncharacterized protein LOC143020664 isoform X2 n=1 Tax=Oratosquilla oratoria TaxID=337810 RepID=UPI003F75F144
MTNYTIMILSERIVVRIGVSTEESQNSVLNEDSLAQVAQFLHFGDHIEGIEDGVDAQPTEERMQVEGNDVQDESSNPRFVFSNMEGQMEAVDEFEEILREPHTINQQQEVATAVPPVSIKIFTRPKVQEYSNQKETRVDPPSRECSGNDPRQSEETNTNLLHGNILQQALINENIQDWEEKSNDEILSTKKSSSLMECKNCHICFIQQDVYLAHVSSCNGNVKESFRCIHCQNTFPSKKAVIQHQLLCKKASNIIVRTSVSSGRDTEAIQKKARIERSDSGNSFTKTEKVVPRKTSSKHNDSEDEEDEEDFHSETDEEALENEQVQYDDDDDDDILYRDMHQNVDSGDDEYEIDVERKTNKHLGPVLVGGKFKCRDCDRTFSKESQYKRHINACTNAPLNAARIDMDFLTPSEVSKAHSKPELIVKEKKKRGRPRKNPLPSESVVVQPKKYIETSQKKITKPLQKKDSDSLQNKDGDTHQKNTDTLGKNTETLKKNAETLQEENTEVFQEKNKTTLQENEVEELTENTADSLQEENGDTPQEEVIDTCKEKQAEDVPQEKESGTRVEKNSETSMEENAGTPEGEAVGTVQENNAETLQEQQITDMSEVKEPDTEGDSIIDSSGNSNQDNSHKKETEIVDVKVEVSEGLEVAGYKCSLCPLKFETSEGMVDHLKEVHSQDVCNMYNLVKGKTSLTSSSCPLCPQFYCTPDLLLLHLVIAHKDRLQQAYKTAEAQDEALPCPWCKYIAHAREFLLEHLALNHLQKISPSENMDDSNEKIDTTENNNIRKRKGEEFNFSSDENQSPYVKKKTKKGRTKMRRQTPHNVFLLKRKHNKDEEVTCPDCDAKFQKINFLVRHKAMGACERALNNQTTKSFHCNEPGCNGRAFYKVVHLFSHQAEVHGQKIPCRKLTFDSLDDCMEWMSSEEKKYNVRYISTYKRITKGKLSSTWVCHRFHSAQFDRRQEKRDEPPSRRWYVKIQRSSNCLARLIMTVSYNRSTKKYDGQTAVTYFHQHSHTEVDHPPEIASRVLERHARDKKVFFVKGVPRKYQRPFGPHLPSVTAAQETTKESKNANTGNKGSELDLVDYQEGNLEHVIEETVVDGQQDQSNANLVSNEEVPNYILQESIQQKQQFWIEEAVPCEVDTDINRASVSRGGDASCDNKIIIGDKAYVVMDKENLAMVDSNYILIDQGGDDISTTDPLIDKVETEVEGEEDEDIYMLPANLEEWNKMFDTVRCKLENGELTDEDAKEVEEMLQSQNVVSLLPVMDQVAIFSKICQIGDIQMSQLVK